MLLKPTKSDYVNIVFYSGKMIGLFGALLLIPFFTAFLIGEWNMMFIFLLTFSICEIIWMFTDKYFYTEKDINWLQGMMVVTVTWLLATLIGAIPYYLSGFWGSYLDCCFDVMSGLTTTGLTLVQDLDHLPYSVNMWRHLLTYIGGQGIIVLGLTFLVRASRGVIKIYVGEAREEKLLPNVVNTARAIWFISLSYLIVGTVVLFISNVLIGLEPLKGFFHSLWIFMSAWSTGGFAPMALNIAYYHSLIIEAVAFTIFIIGSFNFALHWAVWTGNRKEITRNIEIASFTITVSLSMLFAASALIKLNLYTDIISMSRRILFQVGSAHSGTGLMSVTVGQLANQWGEFALLGLILPMALGGSACSTAGGFKALRIGLIVKGIFSEVERLIRPETSVVVTYYHHIRDNILKDSQVKMAGIVILAYISIYLLGAYIGMFYGYSFVKSLFESVSAGANVGLSCGVAVPAMPAIMKLYYILSMWMGRLEFASVFALTGFVVSVIKGKGK